MRGKKREVLFRIESQEHFLEKTSVDNKKLICKLLTHPLHLWLYCLYDYRHWLAFAFLRAMWHDAGELPRAAHEVWRRLCQNGVFQRWELLRPGGSPRRPAVRPTLLQASLRPVPRGREEVRNRWSRLHKVRTGHLALRPIIRWLSAVIRICGDLNICQLWTNISKKYSERFVFHHREKEDIIGLIVDRPTKHSILSLIKYII